MMPGTDGLDLAVMIRKSQWPGETKLVLSSSSGMNDYLTKPIDKQALLNKVAFWTSQDSPGWPKEEAEAGGMEQAS